MRRLTAKKEDRYFENEEFWVDAEEPSMDKIDDVYFKLAEFEDFMEENGFKSLEDLKQKINSWVDEKRVKEIAQESIAPIAKENGILKSRWIVLKKWIIKELGYTSMFQEERLQTLDEIKEIMQELEDGGDEGEEV